MNSFGYPRTPAPAEPRLPDMTETQWVVYLGYADLHRDATKALLAFRRMVDSGER